MNVLLSFFCWTLLLSFSFAALQYHLNGNAISSVQFSASNPGSTTDIDNQVAIVNITVSNITLPVSRMTVTLSGLSASHLQDVAVLISSPTGINVLVLANQYLAGCNEQFGVGCDVNNVNYTFDQTANGTVAANNGISGTYRPSVANDTGRCSGSYLNSFPGLNFSITLDSFNYISGSQVNGVWSLYFKDDCAFQLSSLQGFTFTFYLCGDGNLDQGITPGTGEQCENNVLGCNMTSCRCMNLWEPDTTATGTCRILTCGNGRFDGYPEECDGTQGCESTCFCNRSAGYVPSQITNGTCTLCGNGVLDSGEQCDNVTGCGLNCTCVSPYVNDTLNPGLCTLCGNGAIDPNEECDGSIGCNASCMCDATSGYVPNPNNRGFCYQPSPSTTPVTTSAPTTAPSTTSSPSPPSSSIPSQSPTEPSVQPLSPPAMQQPSNTLPPRTLIPMRSTATRYSIFTIFMVLVLVWVLF